MKGLISQDIAVVSRWRKIRSTSSKSRIKDVSISYGRLFDRLFVSWPDHSSISIFYSQAPLVKVRSLVSVGTYHHFATAILAYIYAFLASQTLHTFGTAVISKLVNVPKLNSFIRVTTISLGLMLITAAFPPKSSANGLFVLLTLLQFVRRRATRPQLYLVGYDIRHFWNSSHKFFAHDSKAVNRVQNQYILSFTINLFVFLSYRFKKFIDLL